MNAIPKDYAAKMHEKGYHPFSVFTVEAGDGLLIRVSALCDEAKIISDALCRLESIKIFGAEKPIKLIGAENAPPINTADAEKYIDEKNARWNSLHPQ